MEESVNSSVSSGDFCSQDGSEASGESTWTMYFEDFMASQEEMKGNISAFGATADHGSSAVSHAASCVVPNTSISLQASEGYKNLSLKRRKGWCLHQDDDPLEDTASSPANSPKVSDLSHTTTEPRKGEDDHTDTSYQEGDINHMNGSEQERELANGFNSIEKADEYTKLRKRGVCLVPISMLVNYLG